MFAVLKACCFVPGDSIRFVPPNSNDSREGTENRKRTNERCRPPPHVLEVVAPGRWHYSCLCDAATAPPGTSTYPQAAGCAPDHRDRAKECAGAGVWRERVAQTAKLARNPWPGVRSGWPVVRKPRCHRPGRRPVRATTLPRWRCRRGVWPSAPVLALRAAGTPGASLRRALGCTSTVPARLRRAAARILTSQTSPAIL